MSEFLVSTAFAIFPVVFCVLLLIYLAIIMFFKKQSSKKTKLNLLFVFIGLSVLITALLAYGFFSIAVTTI